NLERESDHPPFAGAAQTVECAAGDIDRATPSELSVPEPVRCRVHSHSLPRLRVLGGNQGAATGGLVIVQGVRDIVGVEADQDQVGFEACDVSCEECDLLARVVSPDAEVHYVEIPAWKRLVEQLLEPGGVGLVVVDSPSEGQRVANHDDPESARRLWHGGFG